jgi:hypothetical protein
MVQNLTKDKIWTISFNPHDVLLAFTILSVSGYLLFLFVNILEYGVLTISDYLVESHVNGVSYTLLVALHSYSIYAYLILASEHIGHDDVFFRLTALSMLIYMTCLLIVGYLPVDEHDNLHKIFTGLAVFFALISAILPCIHHSKTWESIHKHIYEWIFVICSMICAIVFLATSSAWPEFILGLLILLDKYFKIEIKKNTGAHITNATVYYSLYSPRNRVIPPNIEF